MSKRTSKAHVAERTAATTHDGFPDVLPRVGGFREALRGTTVLFREPEGDTLYFKNKRGPHMFSDALNRDGSLQAFALTYEPGKVNFTDDANRDHDWFTLKIDPRIGSLIDASNKDADAFKFKAVEIVDERDQMYSSTRLAKLKTTLAEAESRANGRE